MIRNLLFGNRSIALSKGGLDAGTSRMRVVAENVANVTTPGYQAKEVAFEELIQEARQSIPMRRTHRGHIQARSTSPADVPRPKVESSASARPEGAVNNVDVEQQMVLLQQNEIHFQALSQLLARTYQGIQSAIR